MRITAAGENYTDRVNYGFPLPDLYFTYDYLEKLGEVETKYSVEVHNHTWIEHDFAKGNSKDWLAYRGFIGGQWFAPPCPFPGLCGAQPAPIMPSRNKKPGDKSHEYYAFSHNETEEGFGNEEGGVSWATVSGLPPD